MRFFSAALALSAVPAVVLGATQTVTVGEGGMQMFNPQTIMAASGDTINFQFMAKNHSATQSLFASPCTKAMFNGTAGVNSGFMATPANVTNGSYPTWSITIKDTKPLWFYCAQKIPAVHCTNGMVFSINPTADKTHEAFVAAAKASGNSTNSSDPSASASASGASPAGASPSDASGSASGATPSGATPSDPAAGAAGASSSDTASAAVATGSGVAAAASSASGTPAAAADNSTPSSSGASKTAFARGAAGLFTVAAAVSAVLL